jgi:tRNA modification GTPase
VAHQPHPRGRGEGQGASLSPRGETIAAIATPPGRGGIGILRVSGPQAPAIAVAISGSLPEARRATLSDFRDAAGELLDRGLVLYFPAPHSYTGEEVVELHAHAGPWVLQQLLETCKRHGARAASPGEFTQRAYLNDRLDLAQAESVADLIDACSAEAARSAARSLVGEFSRRVHALVAALIELRMHVEACIDFPEEEIDPADRRIQREKLAALRVAHANLLAEARQGVVLREGLLVVLAGRPNVGKSSLLNALAGEDLAIVTPIAGTTRDYVRATISLEGVPIHLVDTAGLREATDEVERIGVQRTWKAIESAGAVVFLQDDDAAVEDRGLLARLPAGIPTLSVLNKIDLRGEAAGRESGPSGERIRISAKTGAGVPLVRDWLLQSAGWRPHGEGVFMARARHIAALQTAGEHLEHAESLQAIELQAEELRLAQAALGSITGAVSADHLLGEIFSRFCIGK